MGLLPSFLLFEKMGQIHSHRNLLKPNFKHNALALGSGRGGGIQQCFILERSTSRSNASPFPIVHQSMADYYYFLRKSQHYLTPQDSLIPYSHTLAARSPACRGSQIAITESMTETYGREKYISKGPAHKGKFI